jgi:hypothetical protein
MSAPRSSERRENPCLIVSATAVDDWLVLNESCTVTPPQGFE